ncbi:MAG: ATP-binding protein [Pikeienuella sp.]
MSNKPDTPPDTGLAKRPLSMRAQLSLVSALWSVVALAVAGFVLLQLFRGHIESGVDEDLREHLVQLAALIEVDEKGESSVPIGPLWPTYKRPFSGWVWQVRDGDKLVAQSASLGPMIAGVSEPVLAPIDGIASFTGPGGVPSRGFAREVQPEGATVLTLAIAAPQSHIDKAMFEFSRAMAIAFVLLAVGFVGASYVTTVIALRPLNALRGKVADMRRGETGPEQAWPSEIAPVAQELDGLQTHVDRLVDRARGDAADLAHAVKTPLAVLSQLAEQTVDSQGGEMQTQVARINDYLDRRLGQTRTAGRAVGEVSVAKCVEDIRFALSRDTEERGLSVTISVANNAVFRGDEADLYELVGNLMDNSVKWAASTIEAVAEISDATLTLRFRDDGPGVPVDQRNTIFARGARLDLAAPGQGLGLTIARDIAEAYGGGLTIGDAPQDGAEFIVTLPGGDAAPTV